MQTVSHIAVAPRDTTAPSAQYQLDSQTTTMGHRAHTVTTPERDFAFALFEQALEVDLEPDFVVSRGVWTIGFICNDFERDLALGNASGVMCA